MGPVHLIMNSASEWTCKQWSSGSRLTLTQYNEHNTEVQYSYVYCGMKTYMKEENNNYNLTRYACGLHQFKTQERFTQIKILNTQIIKLMETRLGQLR